MEVTVGDAAVPEVTEGDAAAPEEPAVLAKPDAVVPTEESRSAPPAPFPSEVLERALRAKVLVKHALSRATKELGAVRERLRRADMAAAETERAQAAMAAGDRLREHDDADADAEMHQSLDDTPTKQADEDEAAAADVSDGGVMIEPTASMTTGGADEPAAAAPADADAAADDADGMRPEPVESEATAADGAELSPRNPLRPSPRVRMDDGASRQRNRKMFGMLMGTLRRAQKEGKESGIGLVQQAKLQKIDEKLRVDRSKLLVVKQGEIAERKARDLVWRDMLDTLCADLDARSRRLHVIAHEAQLATFLRTEAEPPIYYLPAKHNGTTRKRLREQQTEALPPLVEELKKLILLPQHPRMGTQQPASSGEASADAAGGGDGSGGPEAAVGTAATEEEEEEGPIVMPMDGEEPLDAIM